MAPIKEENTQLKEDVGPTAHGHYGDRGGRDGEDPPSTFASVRLQASELAEKAGDIGVPPLPEPESCGSELARVAAQTLELCQGLAALVASLASCAEAGLGAVCQRSDLAEISELFAGSLRAERQARSVEVQDNQAQLSDLKTSFDGYRGEMAQVVEPDRVKSIELQEGQLRQQMDQLSRRMAEHEGALKILFDELQGSQTKAGASVVVSADVVGQSTSPSQSSIATLRRGSGVSATTASPWEHTPVPTPTPDDLLKQSACASFHDPAARDSPQVPSRSLHSARLVSSRFLPIEPVARVPLAAAETALSRTLPASPRAQPRAISPWPWPAVHPMAGAASENRRKLPTRQRSASPAFDVAAVATSVTQAPAVSLASIAARRVSTPAYL